MDSPLVSVVVITYNSSKTVVETLESVKNQTYQSIELIVSDDCSCDDTVEIVRKWLDENSAYFINVDLVTTDSNTGVSGNLNRGVAKSHGEWIKSIAGDDILIPSAIDIYMDYIIKSAENVRMCVSDVEPFSSIVPVPSSVTEMWQRFFYYEQETYIKQKKRVCIELVFVGPTFFYKRDLFDSVGGFSEQYGVGEEWPFVFKVIMAGNRIYAINKKLVRYRVSENSLCHNNQNRGLGSERLFRSTYNFFFDNPYNQLIKEKRYIEAWHMFLILNAKMYQYKTNNSYFSKCLLWTCKAISPYTYLKKLKILD